MAWEASTRASRLPSNWRDLRARVLKRDGWICQIAGPRCTRLATEVDHIVAGDDHRLERLQAVCVPCHKEKTKGEAAAAAVASRARTRRPPEPHPGINP